MSSRRVLMTLSNLPDLITDVKLSMQEPCDEGIPAVTQVPNDLVLYLLKRTTSEGREQLAERQRRLMDELELLQFALDFDSPSMDCLEKEVERSLLEDFINDAEYVHGLDYQDHVVVLTLEEGADD